MTNLEVFKNEEFGEVRTVLINDEPYFVGKDVAKVLGYTNPQKALRDHIDEEDKVRTESFTVNGVQECYKRNKLFTIENIFAIYIN